MSELEAAGHRCSGVSIIRFDRLALGQEGEFGDIAPRTSGLNAESSNFILKASQSKYVTPVQGFMEI